MPYRPDLIEKSRTNERDTTLVLQPDGDCGVAWGPFASSITESENLEWKADDDTSPSEVVTGEVTAFELPDGATKGVTASFVMPVNSSLSAISPIVLVAFVVLDTDANANVRFQLDVQYIAVGELTTKVTDETILQTEAVISATDEVHEALFTLDRTLIVASDVVVLHLERLGADGADTFQKAIGILQFGGELQYAVT